jgi:hypothetical protein
LQGQNSPATADGGEPKWSVARGQGDRPSLLIWKPTPPLVKGYGGELAGALLRPEDWAEVGQAQLISPLQQGVGKLGPELSGALLLPRTLLYLGRQHLQRLTPPYRAHPRRGGTGCPPGQRHCLGLERA